MPPTSKQIKKRGDDQLSTNLSGHEVLLLNDITVIISLPPMSYSPHSLCTITDFNLFKHKRNFHYIKSTQCFCGHSCARVRSLPHEMMGVVQVIRCVRGLEWRLVKD